MRNAAHAENPRTLLRQGRHTTVLTGKLVRVRYARDRVIPRYIDAADPAWLDVPDRQLALFRKPRQRTRSELEEELREVAGNDPAQLVHHGQTFRHHPFERHG